MSHRSMPRVGLLVVLGLAACWFGRCPAQDDARNTAIRESLAALGKAFNAHNADGVAAAWSADAVYVDSATGTALTGRDAIRGHYAKLFEAQPKLELKAQIAEIELAGDDSAFVRGTAEVRGGGDEPATSSFVAELAREGGKWLLVSVEEGDADPMDDLAWLIGDWQDENDARARSTFSWDEGGRHIVRSYVAVTPDGNERRGTQFIAWDPSRDELRSWTFDSDGGLAEGVWASQGEHWAIHWSATLADGRTASATQILKPIDDDAFEVHWTDVDVDGEMRPPSEPVRVRRVMNDGAASNQENPRD